MLHKVYILAMLYRLDMDIANIINKVVAQTLSELLMHHVVNKMHGTPEYFIWVDDAMFHMEL